MTGREVTRVVITDSNLGDGALERSILGERFELAVAAAVSEDDVIQVGNGARGLLVQWAPVTSRVLAALPELEVIVRYGIGLDNIDLEAAAAGGVSVHNVDDYCLDEVAEHAVAMILAAARGLVPLHRHVQGGGWFPAPVPPARLAREDPVGIVGLGRIGLGVAARVAALGHPVLGWDPLLSANADLGDLVRVSQLCDLAARVNHLTLHAPATPQTHHLISGEVLRALGPEGHLVNTARGTLVDEVALLRALDDGVIGSASLDVFGIEPPTGTSARLARHPHVLATPHTAWMSSGASERLRRRAAELLRVTLIGSAPEGTAGHG